MLATGLDHRESRRSNLDLSLIISRFVAVHRKALAKAAATFVAAPPAPDLVGKEVLGLVRRDRLGYADDVTWGGASICYRAVEVHRI